MKTEVKTEVKTEGGGGDGEMGRWGCGGGRWRGEGGRRGGGGERGARWEGCQNMTGGWDRMMVTITAQQDEEEAR